MDRTNQALSVNTAAALCGIPRSTLGYWIRTNRLNAERVGKRFRIPVEDLLFFLKSNNRPIPSELADDSASSEIFKPIGNCWEYITDSDHLSRCKKCIAFRRRITACFTARESKERQCPVNCNECSYYLETYLPRIQFIHRIDFPAAIYKDLYFWGGNMKWARLCGLDVKELPGLGIETVVHPESLGEVIANIRKRTLGDQTVPVSYTVRFKNRRRKALKVDISAYPLLDPPSTRLVMAKPVAD